MTTPPEEPHRPDRRRPGGLVRAFLASALGSIVAVAIGSALLPNLSDSVAAGSWDRFRHDLTGGLRLAMFLRG